MDEIATSAPVETATVEAPSEASINERIAEIAKANIKEYSTEKPREEEVKPIYSDKPNAPEKKEAVTDKPEPIKPPNGWTKEEKKEFETLSETAKKAVLRSESEKESLIGHQGRELAKVTKTLESSKEALETHDYVKQVAEKVGAPNARHFVERMVAAQEQSVNDPVGFVARITDQNPIGYIKALMGRYNIDVRQLAAGRDDLAFDDFTHKQQTEFKRIEQENLELKNYLKQQSEYQKQQQEQSQAQYQQQIQEQALGQISDAIESFYSNVGEPEREASTPYLQHAVRVVIAEAKERGEQITSYPELIKKAHVKALRLNENYNPAQGQQAGYARSRAVSPQSRGGSSTGLQEQKPIGSFNDIVATIARNNARKYL